MHESDQDDRSDEGRTPHVLVVDDDRDILELLKDWLPREGFRVTVATNGPEAFERLGSARFDVVLIDPVLPPPGGFEVLRRIKGETESSRTPVVVMTFRRQESGRADWLRSGADDFIGKPFQLGELTEVLRTRVKGRRDIDQLITQTITDPLTGLYNRRHIEERLAEEFVRYARYPETALSVMMLDLDHFRELNKQHGHDCGDLVLRGFATLLRQNKRGTDIVGRFGGEEFLMILPLSNSIHASAVGERIRRAAAETVYPYRDHELRVTVSGGIASVPTNEDVTSAEELVRAADRSLRRAKEKSRNRVLVDPASLPAEIALEGDLSSIFRAHDEDRLGRRGRPREDQG